MDDTRRLRSLPAATERPRLHLHLAGGDERLQTQQRVDSLDEAVAAALREAHVLQEHLLLLIALQLGDVSLGLGADDEQGRLLVLRSLAHRLHISVAVGGRGVIDIADVEHRLRRQQEQVLGGSHLVLGVEGHRAGAATLHECCLVGFQHAQLDLCLLVAAHARLLLHTLHAALNGLQVLQLQLRVDDLLVAHGVHAAIDMHDVRIVEAAQHMDDGVALADVTQELVAQTLTLRGPFHETRDIHDLTRRRHDAPRVYEFRQLIQSLIRDRDLSHLCVDGAKREVGCLRLGAGQTVEQCRFAHVGQAHNTCF